jgi:hypothetical protein
MTYPVTLKISMHGIVSELKTDILVTRTSDASVKVATIRPIVVTAENFGFAKNVVKLADAMGGIRIAPAASVTSDLVFATGNLKPEIEAARAKNKAEQEAKVISNERRERD